MSAIFKLLNSHNFLISLKIILKLNFLNRVVPVEPLKHNFLILQLKEEALQLLLIQLIIYLIVKLLIQVYIKLLVK
jgi:hypothetical protein